MTPSGPPSEAFLEKGRLRVVLTTIGINVVGVALLTLVPWSNWRTGLGLNLIDNALLIAFIVRYKDGLLARFIVFGLTVGITELAADAWLVDHTHTLDYTIGGGPKLWSSPPVDALGLAGGERAIWLCGAAAL